MEGGKVLTARDPIFFFSKRAFLLKNKLEPFISKRNQQMHLENLVLRNFEHLINSRNILKWNSSVAPHFQCYKEFLICGNKMPTKCNR